ncbi:MAG: ribosome maturation factor RimP [Azonexus sp.]|jgi:ribosome maturation factor RimP|uniref:ribosome maturation factor RimP n=1 Tax=Azonexus sp. TaxID=1872668 RepID=UPI00282EE885|nr:ribosome maturation factor RimP [Azonexus sp.]MDR0776842.1 ribosome maturation factor RimP [Azonexus sp.]
MDLNTLIETTASGLGYELVDVEMSPRGRTIRVFIDAPGKESGVDVEDCARLSNQLTRLFEVENVDFDRLEISSPGLDRVVKKAEDFARFAGQDIQIKIRIPLGGRRNFQGELLGCKDGKVGLRLEKEEVELEFANIEKARLVPRFD